MDAQRFIDAVRRVTSKWTKQRMAEERSKANVLRRDRALFGRPNKAVKAAAWQVMEAAYLAASDGNAYPAHARQVMYAARGPIQELTGEPLDDRYFTQNILPDYLREHEEATADWDVVFDARGHLTEPHTGSVVPLGTLDVREYVARMKGGRPRRPRSAASGRCFPTVGARNRFSAVLFIEKEGFLPLFRQAMLAERFDVAIMSTKGISVTAARSLVDEFAGMNVPCLVVRDFDKAGFTLCRSLQADGRRYQFRNRPRVIDLGLRLDDVRRSRLADEEVVYGKSDPRDYLERNGATPEEVDFLCDEPEDGDHRGRRVELNAFSSGEFIRWLEAKLVQNGVRKVQPDDGVLLEAYRRACAEQIVRKRVRLLRSEARRTAETLELPADLAAEVRSRTEASPQLPWDGAVMNYVASRGDPSE